MAAIDESFAPEFQDRRRYDLDWLRAIAFGLLIFYHIGMFYVTWGWHVKSEYAGPAAEPLMLLVNPWRLALLFFISGVAIRFATDKAASAGGFFRSRLARLALPILAGMIVIVAPQSYFELRQAGAIEPGFLAFWPRYLDLKQHFSMITPTWNHLWYVVYLLVYIALITPFLKPMRRFAEGRGAALVAGALGGPVRLLLIAPLPFLLYEATLSDWFPTTHNLVWDWGNHAHRLTIFLYGYFLARHAGFWRSVDRALPLAAMLVIAIAAARLYLRAAHRELYVALFEDIPVLPVLLVFYAWAAIVLLLGLAQRYLNRPSPTLRYLTGAVFCYYILHQTVIVWAGYHLTQMRLGPWPEFLALMAITIFVCAAGYEIVRRIPGLRLLFGVRERAPAPATFAAGAAAA